MVYESKLFAKLSMHINISIATTVIGVATLFTPFHLKRVSADTMLSKSKT